MRFKKYRIARNEYLEYEVQFWSLWFPFWRCVNYNRFKTIDGAKEYYKEITNPFPPINL